MLSGLLSAFLLTGGMMASYYVDATGGNDGYAGTEAQPFKTLSKINGLTLNPGDNVYLKRGETWRESLTLTDSGTNGNPITIAAYGSGAVPIISGADKKTSWSLYSGSVWRSSCSTQPDHVLINKRWGNKQSSLGAVNTYYEWYWGGGYLYLYSPAGNPNSVYTSGGIEAQARDHCIYAANEDYISIWYIRTEAGVNGIFFNSSHHCRMEYCEAHYNFSSGLRYALSNYAYVGHCVASYNGEIGIRATGEYNTGNDGTIEYCTAHHNGTDQFWDWYTGYYGTSAWTANIKLWGHGVPISYIGVARWVIQHNTVYSAGPVGKSLSGSGIGIWIDECNTGIHVRYNRIYNNNSSGVDIEQTHEAMVYYNFCYDNCLHVVSGEIRLRRNPQRCKVYNNTCVNGNYGGIAFIQTTDTSTFDDNQCINNLCYGNAYAELYISLGASNRTCTPGDGHSYTGSGNIYRYNCCGAEHSGFLRCSTNTSYSDSVATYNEFEDSSHLNTNTYSIESTPTFEDAAALNYRALSASSPQVDAGTSLGLTRDYDGHVVPYNSIVDVGAFEYGSGTPTEPDPPPPPPPAPPPVYISPIQPAPHFECLNYTYHTSVESPQQLLSYIAAFAVAQGWSLVEWRDHCAWSSGVGWIDGNDTYMELSSTGYGSQALRYRIHAKYDDSRNTWIYLSGARPDDPEYDTGETWAPNLQWTHSWWQACGTENPTLTRHAARMSMPSGRFPALWVWGDGSTVIVIMQLSALLYDSFAFGSPRLFSEFQDTTEAHGLWVGKDSYADETVDAYWWNFEEEWDRWFWCFAAYPGPSTNWASPYFKQIYWDGDARGYEYGVAPEYGTSLHICRTGGTWGNFTYTQYGRGPQMKNVVSYNDWTDKRVGIAPVVIVGNVTGSYPSPPDYAIGTLPFCYIPWTGLAPGETLMYGLDKYKVFPMNVYLDTYGVALRYE